jgi:hypothetical protein
MSNGVIRLELSIEDAKLLHGQLAYRIADLDRDLVRTDQHRLQHALAQEVKRLEAILERLDVMMRDAGAS